MKISIVFPTYNERDNISRLLPEVFRICKKSNLDCNVIIVDDNSPDGTAKIAEKLAKKYDITIIQRPSKLGLGSAYITGFKKALELKSDYIFSMDADLSHQPREIQKFLQKMDSRNYDLVVGSRYMSGGGSTLRGWRKFVSKGANLLAKSILGLATSDVTTGYRCYRASSLAKIDLDSIKTSGYSFLEEILFLFVRKGFRIGETPIYFDERWVGKSKLGAMEMLMFFANLLRLKFNAKKNNVSKAE